MLIEGESASKAVEGVFGKPPQILVPGRHAVVWGSGLARIEIGEGNKVCDYVKITDRSGIVARLLATDIGGSPKGAKPSWIRFSNISREVIVFEDGRVEAGNLVAQQPQQPGQTAA